ncbi:hypothetical protein D3C76_1011410 [compost metagenome]
MPGAHDAHARRQFGEGQAYWRLLGVDLQDGGAGVLKPVQRATKTAFQFTHQGAPVEAFAGGLQGQLDPAIGHFIAIDGEAGTVRATVGHGLQHRFEKLAQPGFQLRVFQVKTYDSAH